jgi:hypothetical protein
LIIGARASASSATGYATRVMFHSQESKEHAVKRFITSMDITFTRCALFLKKKSLTAHLS